MSESYNAQTGDIYLVRFHPGYGSELRKYRPAVIVSGKISKLDSRFTLIAPLTTNSNLIHPDAELLVQSNPALSQDSVLLCWYLWTIDSSRLIRKLGELSKKDLQNMQKLTAQIFTAK